MEDQKIIRFLWSRSYMLPTTRDETQFFKMVERTKNFIVFELNQKDNHQQVCGMAFVPEGEQREVMQIEWNGKKTYLLADNFIARGMNLRRDENGTPQILVGDTWVDLDKNQEAVKKMDEKNK